MTKRGIELAGFLTSMAKEYLAAEGKDLDQMIAEAVKKK